MEIKITLVPLKAKCAVEVSYGPWVGVLTSRPHHPRWFGQNHDRIASELYNELMASGSFLTKDQSEQCAAALEDIIREWLDEKFKG